MLKGKALRRALESQAVIRVNAGDSVPLITDTTELITPEMAHALLKHNAHNRPISWAKVEEYADIMRRGEWRLTAQGIVLDPIGNILTGQKRLWGVVYSGVPVYMRVSRGTPAETAPLLDRGTPQTARDLAARQTGRKHAPIETGIGRAYLALLGNLRPTTDVLAHVLEVHATQCTAMLAELQRTKKTKELQMILGAICGTAEDLEQAVRLARHAEELAAVLVRELAPMTVVQCWNRGAAFGLAMDRARRLVTACAG